jgi:hypothetical protein
MDIPSLIDLGLKAAEMVGKFHRNYETVKDTLSTEDQQKLNEVLNSIHNENMKLSSDIDDAVRRAEKRT